MTQEIKILIGIGIATLLVIVGAVFFLSSSAPAQEVSEETIAQNQEYLVREDSNTIGSPSARVTIVEFGDFQCPACKAAHPAVKQILNEYPDDVYFVFRHYPLPMHRNAKIAAYAAEAAGEQGQFFEMHDLLYENQEEWAESTGPMDIFNEFATELGLDLTQFAEDIKKEEIASGVSNDQKDGNLVGVSATPTFYINGKQAFKGVPSYSDFKTALEAEMGS